MKHKHVWTPICIANYTDKDLVWRWCIRCGALKLGKETFLPSPHQKMVVLPEKPK